MTLPPGFATTAADGQLARTLGLERHGFLLHLLREARPLADPPGSWAVATTNETLAEQCDIGRDKVIRLLKDLRAVGLVETVPGKRLGRGFGSTPTVHFLATDPSMVLPGPRGGSTVRTSTNGVSMFPTSQDAMVEPRRLVAVPQVGSTVGVSDVVTSGGVMNVIDEQSIEGRVPSIVVDALRAIGWAGPMPVLAGVQPDVVVALARWVAGRGNITNRAAYLRRILETPGEAGALALSLGLTPKSALTAVDAVESPAAMGVEEFWDAYYADAEWAAAVTAEAARVSGVNPPRLLAMRRIGAEFRANGISSSREA